MLTLNQLITPVAEDDALTTILGILTQLGFQATSWQSGAIQLVLVRLIARLYSSVTQTVSSIAAGGFTTLSSSSWLTLIAKYIYSLDRLDPTPTIGMVLLTNSAGAPSHTFSAGDVIVSDSPSGSDNANTYTYTGAQGTVTLAPNSTVSIEVKSNVAGSAANIAPNTTLYLWTPLVGTTPSNPVIAPSNTWITTPGQDAEADQRLIDRCIGRWAKLTYSNTDGAYKGWALDALDTLTRTQVLSAPGDGTVTLVGATAIGPISGGDITTIQNYIQGISDGVGRRTINDIFSAVAATVQTSPALTVTVYCLPAVVATIGALITQALLTYIGTVPIGGTVLTGTQGRVLHSELMTICQGQDGVRSIVLSIASDVLLNPGEIYTPAITVNPIAVAPGV